MSEENVGIVREQFDAFGRGELSPYWDADVIITPPAGWPEAQEIRGRQAWRRQLERLRDSWENARIEVEDIRPAGEDRVFARFRYVTTGADSGISFDTPMGAVFTIRSGKIVRGDFFRFPADALEAAGLSE